MGQCSAIFFFAREEEGVCRFYFNPFYDLWLPGKKKKKSALNATISTSKTAMSQTIVDNRMRYAKKSPEERKSTKFSQAACLNEDTCSSGADVNADLSGEANPAPPEPKQDKRKKKCSRKRPRTSEEAQMAHIYGDVTRLWKWWVK